MDSSSFKVYENRGVRYAGLVTTKIQCEGSMEKFQLDTPIFRKIIIIEAYVQIFRLFEGDLP